MSADFPWYRMLLGAMLFCAPLQPLWVGAAEQDKNGDQNRLLGNSQATGPASGEPLPPLEQLQGQLGQLWDARAIGRPSLEAEVVYSQSNVPHYADYKIEGIYINGAQVASGGDRIFFYYARPKHAAGKVPVYIELTGGAKDEIANLWMAAQLKCAVVHVEYRCSDARFRSKWAGYPQPGHPIPTMQEMSSLRNNFLYRMVSGTRRVIDYLAAQPEVDAATIGCGGGSMGGYLTLLLAGVDARIRFGVDELGAGWRTKPLSHFGNLAQMPDDYKAVWSQAFNAYNYAAATKARMFVSLSANDAAFWLGDGLDNYRALPGEKRLGINPNDNHTAASFGREHWLPLFAWAPYCLGAESDYPQLSAVRAEGRCYAAAVSDRAALQSVSLYWSPGNGLAWPARYWQEIPAVLENGTWRAEVPARYAELARYGFLTAVDVKGRRVSSPPLFTPGSDPREVAGPLWDDDQLWDVHQGAAAWRSLGLITARQGAPKSQVTFLPPHSLTVGPGKAGKAFSLLTNSIILAAGHAKAQRGLELTIDGNGKPGELLISLARNMGSTRTEEEFSHALKYGAAKSRYRIPWSEFSSKKYPGQSPLGFDGLRIDGRRDDGSTITIGDIAFF